MILKQKISQRNTCALLLGSLFCMLYLSQCASTNIHTNMPYPSPVPKNHAKKAKDPALLHKVSNRGAALGHKCPCKPQKIEKPVSPASFSSQAQDTPSEESNGKFEEVGLASWYGRDFDGKATASGEIFDSRKLTAAHKTIPLGSIILARNMENEKEVFLKVNDRGPFIEGRILDVSEYGAEVLGYKEDGLTHVGIRIVRQAPSSNKKSVPQGRGATYEFFKNRTEAEKSEPASDEKESLADSIAPAEAQSGYSVQVGAFSDLRYARKLEQQLGEYEQPVKLSRRGTKYIVRAGSFKNRQEAEELKLQLKGDGFSVFVAEPD